MKTSLHMDVLYAILTKSNKFDACMIELAMFNFVVYVETASDDWPLLPMLA